VSPKGKRCYQALTELDRRKWMQSLTQSSINALQRASSLSQGNLNQDYQVLATYLLIDRICFFNVYLQRQQYSFCSLMIRMDEV
jgi:hypothetical protein